MPKFFSLLLACVLLLTAQALSPTLPNVSLGVVETVVDWASQHCNCSESPGCTDPNDPDYTDTPPRAYVSADNILHLWSTDAQSRQATRQADAPTDQFYHNCSVHAASQFNCFTNAYNFQTWLHSPYMMNDGINAFALTHMEYHGWSCAGNSSCPNNEGGDCANEAIQLFVSSNGGWDWRPSDESLGPPSNLIAVSPYTYEYSRDHFNHSELGFGDPTSVVFDKASGTYNALISASNPEIGDNGWIGPQQRGQCIIRSSTPMLAASWKAWDGVGFNVQFKDPYLGPLTNLSAYACKPVNTSMIHVNMGWSVYFNKWISSGFGSYKYENGTEIPCCGAFLYTVSDDLLNWETPQLIRPCQEEGKATAWEYDPALLDESAWSVRGVRNLHESIGKEAHLFFWQQDETGHGRSIKRQAITFGP